jgi:hypothetical protein
MLSVDVVPRPIVILLKGRKLHLPTRGFPLVAEIDTDIPVKHPEYAKYTDHMVIDGDIRQTILVTVGDARALYMASGFDLSGNLVCDMLAQNNCTTGDVMFTGDFPDAVAVEIKRLLLEV